MKRVLKWPVDLRGETEVRWPKGSRVVHVAAQNDVPTLWTESPEVAEQELVVFACAATGFTTIRDTDTYVGTVHIDWTVWHVYEVRRG